MWTVAYDTQTMQYIQIIENSQKCAEIHLLWKDSIYGIYATDKLWQEIQMKRRQLYFILNIIPVDANIRDIYHNNKKHS